jgi:flavin-binding protein dodecin
MGNPLPWRPHNGGNIMANHVYKKIELVGTSEVSVEDAISTAIDRSSKTIRNLRWFEVTQLRGEIRDGKVSHYQVSMNVGFTLEW